MTSRKKPGVAFWVAVVLVVALVAYPLSMAPAYWVLVRLGTPDWLMYGLGDFYGPLWTVLLYGPDDLFGWFVWYSNSMAGVEYSID
jgi:hypothetical protein